MWISKQLRPMPPTADTDLGTTTIQGEQVGVMTRGEVRALPVYGPGGYVWMPENGAAVLVVKGGPGGEEQCVAGMRQASPPKVSGAGGGVPPQRQVQYMPAGGCDLSSCGAMWTSGGR